MLSSIHEPVWQRFCEIIGRPDVAANPHWTGRTRNVDGEAFHAIIEDAFVGRTTAEWMAELGPAGVLATPAASCMDVLADEQAIASGYIRTIEHPEHGPLKLVGGAIEFGGGELREASDAPEPGADTTAVLAELGYASGDIARLRDDGVISGG